MAWTHSTHSASPTIQISGECLAPRTVLAVRKACFTSHEPEIFLSGSFSFCRRHHCAQLPERVSKACTITSPGPTPRAGLCEKRPGRYTQQLVSRAREAGLRVREVRTVDAAASDIGLIVSCGSPVVLTEPVDLREHVAKTTAAMLQFPDAPVVGICYGMQLLALLYGGRLAEQRESAHKGEWTELRRSPVKSRLPNVIVWSSACSACDKAEHWLESLRLLNQMPGKKLQPNVISYGAALSACARVAKWQHAIALLEDVLASGAGRFSPLAKVIQISDEQDEQDEVILLQLGAPVFRRTSNSSTEFPAHCRTFGPDDGSPIASFPSGRHQLKDLMLCPEVKLIPPHVSLQAEWVSAKPRGLLWLPDSFNGVVPVAHATPDFLAYYGAAMASSCNISAVDVKAEQQIVDFEYSYTYKERWVLNPGLGPGALGLQRHNFAHLECPLDDDNGILLLGKLVGKELHLTGFRCPCFHTIYLAPRVIHSKDHLLRRWRTSMTSVAEDALSTEVDHVLLQQMAESGGTVHDVDLRFEEAFNLVQQGPRACLKTTAKDGPRLSSLDEECEECDEDEAEQDIIPSQKPRPSVESLYTLMSSSTARVRVSVDSSASGVSAIFPGILPSLPLMPEAPSSRVEPPQLLVRHSGGTMEDRLGDAAYGKLLARMGHHASLLYRTRHRALPATAREEHRFLQLQALCRQCLWVSSGVHPRAAADLLMFALTVDNISFASAISACQKASRWERSLQLLWQTEASGLSPDIVCFNAAISACACS
eukprot:s301_g2.t1